MSVSEDNQQKEQCIRVSSDGSVELLKGSLERPSVVNAPDLPAQRPLGPHVTALPQAPLTVEERLKKLYEFADASLTGMSFRVAKLEAQSKSLVEDVETLQDMVFEYDEDEWGEEPSSPRADAGTAPASSFQDTAYTSLCDECWLTFGAVALVPLARLVYVLGFGPWSFYTTAASNLLLFYSGHKVNEEWEELE